VTGFLRSKQSAAAQAIYPVMTAVFITVFCHGGAVASDLTLPVVDALGVGPTWDGSVATFDREIDFASESVISLLSHRRPNADGG
jgi:hypothetical protein